MRDEQFDQMICRLFISSLIQRAGDQAGAVLREMADELDALAASVRLAEDDRCIEWPLDA
jgi:hypothetical protein